MNDLTAKPMHGRWVEKLPPLRLLTCWAILSMAMAIAYFLVAAGAFVLNGTWGFIAATIAAGVCYLGSTLALVGTSCFGRTGINAPMYTLAIGMACNCALPFLVGLILNRAGGSLADAGVFGLTMIFFLPALFVETLLSLCLIKSPR